MVRFNVAGAFTVLFLVVTMIVGDCYGQNQTENQAAKGLPNQEAPAVTIKAKIGDVEYMGGYFVHDQETNGEFFIVNPNPDVLKEIHASLAKR